MKNAEFMELDQIFLDACTLASRHLKPGIAFNGPTKRQASKFRQGKGFAHRFAQTAGRAPQDMAMLKATKEKVSDALKQARAVDGSDDAITFTSKAISFASSLAHACPDSLHLGDIKALNDKAHVAHKHAVDMFAVKQYEAKAVELQAADDDEEREARATAMDNMWNKMSPQAQELARARCMKKEDKNES